MRLKCQRVLFIVWQRICNFILILINLVSVILLFITIPTVNILFYAVGHILVLMT